MDTTHRFTITSEQLRAIISEKFGIPEPRAVSITAETSEDTALVESLNIEFGADFKTAAKVAKKVERFQGVEESEE